jgi:Glycine zipper
VGWRTGLLVNRSMGVLVGDLVRALSGALVGALVGRLVGALSGALVGALVGRLVGALIGVLVGALVGRLVGALIGVLVGVLVGRLVGALTGTFVGALVGRLVGALTGAFVGALVGRLVGALTGAFVGALVELRTVLTNEQDPEPHPMWTILRRAASKSLMKSRLSLARFCAMLFKDDAGQAGMPALATRPHDTSPVAALTMLFSKLMASAMSAWTMKWAPDAASPFQKNWSGNGLLSLRTFTSLNCGKKRSDL